MDKKLLKNGKNTKGNGYIVINDEKDYPEGLKDLRLPDNVSNDKTAVYDFWKNKIFELDNNTRPIYCEGLAPFRNSDDLWGYIDKDGKTVIEPQFTYADVFRNGTANVRTENEDFYIDKKGNRAENRAFEGFEGKMREGYSYGTFTGRYSSYFYLKDDTYPVYGYVDAKGDHKDIKDADSVGTFINGYALVDKGLLTQVIDEEFNTVADLSDFDRGPILSQDINLYWEEENYMCGSDYIFDGSYMIYVPVYSNKMKVIKIAPELYSDKK